jgi:hypothetical protein
VDRSETLAGTGRHRPTDLARPMDEAHHEDGSTSHDSYIQPTSRTPTGARSLLRVGVTGRTDTQPAGKRTVLFPIPPVGGPGADSQTLWVGGCPDLRSAALVRYNHANMQHTGVYTQALTEPVQVALEEHADFVCEMGTKRRTRRQCCSWLFPSCLARYGSIQAGASGRGKQSAMAS